MTPEQFRDVLAACESNSVKTAWGDNLCAMGEFQAHPAWAWQFAHRYNIFPTLNGTWNDWISRILRPFFLEYAAIDRSIEIAMRYHRGHRCHTEDSDWDVEYVMRFSKAAAALGIALD